MQAYEDFTDSLSQIIKKIPREFFVKSRSKAYGSILMTLACIALSLAAIYLLSTWDSLLKWPVGILFSWYFMGTAMTGGFDIAHDAAHRSLFDNVFENNFWGHIFSSLVGWPFHLWRHAHNIHHKFTNNARKDIAWEPHPEEHLLEVPPILRSTYVLTKSKIFVYWLGGFFHLFEQFVKFGRGKRFAAKDRPEIWFSIATTGLIFASYAWLTASWGLFGWVVGFVVPICRFYFWLTTFTMLHHLHPEKPFLVDAAWQKQIGAAQLLGTINVRYSRYTDHLTHNIAWHIPHHVSVAIPHYHLKRATLALQKSTLR